MMITGCTGNQLIPCYKLAEEGEPYTLSQRDARPCESALQCACNVLAISLCRVLCRNSLGNDHIEFIVTTPLETLLLSV